MPAFTKSEAMKAILEKDRFEVDDPEVAKIAAEEYVKHVEDGHPDDGLDLMEFTVWEANQRFDDKEAKPTENMSEYNAKAAMRAEGVASKQADRYEEDNLIADGGTRTYVENAKEEIEELDDTIQSTNWESVRLHIKNELRNGMWNDDYLIQQMKDIIDTYSQYDYNEQQKMEFVNEIINYVSEDEAETITHKIISKMSQQEAKNKELKEESVSSSIKETVKEGVARGAGEKVIDTLADKVGMKTLMALASAIGSAVAGIPLI